MDAFNPETKALEHFRKLVSFLYHEIGAMRRPIHLEIFDRSTMATSGFAARRKWMDDQAYMKPNQAQ